MSELLDQDRAERLARANMSPRYCRLEHLGSWAIGTQYKGRPSFWDGTVPLWEREPCIVYPIVRMAAESNCDLVLGEGRFPSFHVEIDDSIGKGEAEDTDKSERDEYTLDSFLDDYHEQARFYAAARDAFLDGQSCGTAVLFQGVRNGRPFCETIPAKWCTPSFGANGELSAVEISYPYLDEYRRASDGKWAVRAMVYRRVIDTERDTEFFPIEAAESEIEPDAWRANPAKSATHNLGFVPCVWYAFNRGTQPVNVIDGRAIHQWVTDEIQAHDIARSQWHRGALYSEPYRYEVGVKPGYNPTGSGRVALVPTTEHGGATSPNNPMRGAFVDPEQEGKQGARKQGPGYWGQYPTGATVDQLVYPGDALKVQQDNCADLRIKLQEALAVVFLDPENIKFAATTSGKALEAIKQKQLDRCDTYREDLRDNLLVPAVKQQLKIAQKLQGGLKVPGVDEALTLMSGITDPVIEVKWGNYFKPDPLEQQQILGMVVEAVTAGLITKKAAVEKIAPIFGIEDVESLLEELKKEADENAVNQDAALENAALAFHNGQNSSGNRRSGGAEPTATPEG